MKTKLFAVAISALLGLGSIAVAQDSMMKQESMMKNESMVKKMHTVRKHHKRVVRHKIKRAKMGS